MRPSPLILFSVSLSFVLGSHASAFAAEDAAEEGSVPSATVDADHATRMAAGLDLFKKHVKPILVGRCIRCHGGEDTLSVFELIDRDAMLRGGAEGDVVVPGKAGASRLVKLIRHEEEPQMPEDGAKLSDVAIQHIVDWINLGAPYDGPLVAEEEDPQAWTHRKIDDSRRDFWSFQPLREVAPPAVGESDWVQTDIDRFLLAAMQERGITPNEPTSRRKLIRRATFDLTGLPPTREEVEAFVNDPDPRAFEAVIDRLLESPHYGERWGRHWLDVARFAESHGFEQDYDRPHAYHFRDFVIRALNADMPFDQFVRWQLAGDRLEPDEPLAWMATGFLGAGVFPTQLTEKEFEPARYDELDDMVATTGTAMLGLTIGCARCHDHKFDPIPAADYYRLIATFTTAIRGNVELDLDPADGKEELTSVMVVSEGIKPIPHHADGRGFPHFYPETYFLHRGDTQQKQGLAKPGFLQVLTSARSRPDTSEGSAPTDACDGVDGEAGAGGGESDAGTGAAPHPRVELADWITDVDGGAGDLLARVIVNRLWQHHFGRGIVATPNDFGFQGTRPTHPELLDWLAAQLIADGWRLKPLHKRMMTSAAYLQSSRDEPASAAIDPDNQWFWKYEPQRLEAEIIRDAMLALSGRLDRTQFGPGSLDEGMQRRSIYFMIKRSKLVPMMQIFDAPEPLVGVGRRPSTTIAPQALMFMNNPHVRDYARAFAERVLGETPPTTAPEWQAAAVDHAYAMSLSRPPTEAELRDGVQFLNSQARSYKADGQADATARALTDFCQVLMSLNEFVYVD